MVSIREIEESLQLENQICFSLYACAKEIVRQYSKSLSKLNLTYTQYIVMMVLWEYGSMTEGEIGKKVYLDSGTLAPLLKRLEKQGLVNRIRPENNERKLLISLTNMGEKLKDEAKRVPYEMKDCISISKKELVKLQELLKQIIMSMDNKNK